MKVNKAIILAGGSAKRLGPITQVTSKHLLPIYNKPMIYYPISTLMLAGIKKYLIITNPQHLNSYKDLLGNGNKYGIKINYLIQKKPKGLPDAFLLAEKFIGKDPVCLNLGDHILFGRDITPLIKKNINNFKKTTLFAYLHKNPKNFGVINFDKNLMPLSIEEKPNRPRSKYIITGLYIYDNKVIKFSKKLRFSKRNELEISDLNNIYLKNNDLNVEIIKEKNYWIDAGTSKSLLSASNTIFNIENSKNKLIGSLEIIAYENNFINKKQLKKLIDFYQNNDYRNQLLRYYKKL